MRTKDAVDGEKKVLARNAERQTVVIEKLSASEKSLGMLLVSAAPAPALSSPSSTLTLPPTLASFQAEQEKKVTLLQQQLQQQQSRADDLQRQSMEAKGRLDGESARAADLEKVVASKAVSGDKDRAALMRAEEELARARRDAEKAEKALAKMKAAVSSAAASGTATVDPELREERDKLYVRRLLPFAPPSCGVLTADRLLSPACAPVHPPLLDLLPSPAIALHHQVHAQ